MDARFAGRTRQPSLDIMDVAHWGHHLVLKISQVRWTTTPLKSLVGKTEVVPRNKHCSRLLCKVLHTVLWESKSCEQYACRANVFRLHICQRPCPSQPVFTASSHITAWLKQYGTCCLRLNRFPVEKILTFPVNRQSSKVFDLC